jgi:ArsR family transcriptional regulator, arsenate/arsenite/antimonite-responsive transcriptional repressor
MQPARTADCCVAMECATPLVREPISESAADELARVFKALADPVRLRLVSLIGAHADGEICVCDLTAAFELTQPTISHHLRVLREAGLIDSERRGTWVYYRILPAALDRIAGLLAVSVSAAAGRSAAGHSPGSVPGFVGAQMVGGALGIALVHVLYPARAGAEADGAVPAQHVQRQVRAAEAGTTVRSS